MNLIIQLIIINEILDLYYIKSLYLKNNS